MSKIRLTGETSGYVEISAGDAATNNTLELPTSGTKVVASDDNGNITTAGIVTATGGFGVGTGASVYSPATNVLALGTNSAERVRINSSGNVGIGTDNPTVFGTAYRTLQLNPAAGTGDGSAIRFMYDGGTANTNDLVIYTNSSQSYIRANGARNLDIMRNGSTVATFNANGIALPSGLGIDFSAASGSAAGSTSALLDDYEEGTFTPTFTGSSSNPTVGYNDQIGRYIKVGRMCFIVIRIVTSSVSSGSGDVRISGLPFTAFSDTYGGAITPAFIYNWSTNPVRFIVSGGTTYITLYSNDSTNTLSQVSHLNTSNFTNYTNISGCYYTA